MIERITHHALSSRVIRSSSRLKCIDGVSLAVKVYQKFEGWLWYLEKVANSRPSLDIPMLINWDRRMWYVHRN